MISGNFPIGSSIRSADGTIAPSEKSASVSGSPTSYVFALSQSFSTAARGAAETRRTQCISCRLLRLTGNLTFPFGKFAPLRCHGDQLRPPCRISHRFGKCQAFVGVFTIPFCSAHLITHGR